MNDKTRATWQDMYAYCDYTKENRTAHKGRDGWSHFIFVGKYNRNHEKWGQLNRKARICVTPLELLHVLLAKYNGKTAQEIFEEYEYWTFNETTSNTIKFVCDLDDYNKFDYWMTKNQENYAEDGEIARLTKEVLRLKGKKTLATKKSQKYVTSTYSNSMFKEAAQLLLREEIMERQFLKETRDANSCVGARDVADDFGFKYNPEPVKARVNDTIYNVTREGGIYKFFKVRVLDITNLKNKEELIGGEC